MKRKKRPRRRADLHLFEGNVWVMPSAQVATEVYQTLLKQFLKKNPAEWSLVNGYFQRQPILAFLWDPSTTVLQTLRTCMDKSRAGFVFAD